MTTRRFVGRWKTFGAWLLLAGMLLSILAIVGRSRRMREVRKPVSYPSTRALFVWDTQIPGDSNATGELLGFARDKGLNLFFLDCSPVASDSATHAAFEEFVQWSHAAGIRVFALGGFPWWSVPDGAGIAGQLSGHGEGWAYYQAIMDSGIPFDGIADDTEPYLANTADWWGQPVVRAQYYLDWLTGVRATTGGLPLYSVIPFWYDSGVLSSMTLRGERTPRPLNAYVSGIVDAVLVMSYRDSALGPDGMIEHSRGEIATGPAFLGAETNYLGSDPVSDKTTFWEEGEAHMERELALVLGAFRGDSHLRGLFVHDARAFSVLAP